MGLALGRKSGRAQTRSSPMVSRNTECMLESGENATVLPDLGMTAMLRHRVMVFHGRGGDRGLSFTCFFLSAKRRAESRITALALAAGSLSGAGCEGQAHGRMMRFCRWRHEGEGHRGSGSGDMLEQGVVVQVLGVEDAVGLAGGRFKAERIRIGYLPGHRSHATACSSKSSRRSPMLPRSLV